jgi:hypothetical protein
VARARVARSPAELLRILGRVALWCVLLVLLARGLSDVMAAREPVPVAAAPRAAASAWPSDDARALAVQFTRAYLGFMPRDGQDAAAELEAFVAPELANSIVPVASGRGTPREVQDAVVARAARVDDRHALITVAATIAGSSAPRLLTVPVARDAAGGLVVSDLPAFAAPPPHAAVSAPALDPLPAAERAGIEDLLSRFFRAFLAGRGDELTYLVPAGTRIAAVAAPLELVGIDALQALPGASGGGRWVLASIRARDRASGVSYGLRYRVRVVRGDRWLVAAVDSSPKGG